MFNTYCFVEKDHAFFQIIGKLRVAVVSSSITNSLEFPLHDGGAGATPSATTVRVTELLISIVGSEIIIKWSMYTVKYYYNLHLKHGSKSN